MIELEDIACYYRLEHCHQHHENKEDVVEYLAVFLNLFVVMALVIVLLFLYLFYGSDGVTSCQ